MEGAPAGNSSSVTAQLPLRFQLHNLSLNCLTEAKGARFWPESKKITTWGSTFYYKSVLTFVSSSLRGQIACDLRDYSPKTPSSFPRNAFLHRGTAVSTTALNFKRRKHVKKPSALPLGQKVPYTVLLQGGFAAFGARSPTQQQRASRSRSAAARHHN